MVVVVDDEVIEEINIDNDSLYYRISSFSF